MSDPQGSPNRHLVYSVDDGVTVQRMVIDPTATRGASLAFDRGEPAIAYVAAGGLELRMARRSAGVWGIQSVETVTSSSVGLPALAFSPVSFEPGIGWQTASDVVLSRGLPQRKARRSCAALSHFAAAFLVLVAGSLARARTSASLTGQGSSGYPSARSACASCRAACDAAHSPT